MQFCFRKKEITNYRYTPARPRPGPWERAPSLLPAVSGRVKENVVRALPVRSLLLRPQQARGTRAALVRSVRKLCSLCGHLQRAATDGHLFPRHLPSPPPRQPVGQDGAHSFPGRGAGSGWWGGGRSTCLSLFCSRPSASVRSVTLNSGHGPRVQDPLLLGKVSVSSSGKRPSSDENKLESPQRVPRASEVSASLTTWAEDTPARPAMWNPLAFPPGRDGTGREGRLAGSAGSPPSDGPIPTAPARATLLNTK